MAMRLARDHCRFILVPFAPAATRFRSALPGVPRSCSKRCYPRVLIATETSRLTLEGGTHNSWAPPFDFLDKAFFPLVGKLGPCVSAQLECHGFFPAGGGRFHVIVDPVPQLRGLNLVDRGDDGDRRVIAIVSKLPIQIAQRELDTICRKIELAPDCALCLRSHRFAGAW